MTRPTFLTLRREDGRFRRFHAGHLLAFFITWWPLNLAALSAYSSSVGWRSVGDAAIGIAATVFGPYAPKLYDPTVKLPQDVVLVATGALMIGITAQLFWGPRSKAIESIRLMIFALGCWIWFASTCIVAAYLM